MRLAEPHELTTHAYPVLTAAISDSELRKWFPVTFQRITDPEEAAEPSKAAVVRLDAGEYFVAYYGELSNQLILRIPTSSDPSRFLNALLSEVPLPRARVVWRRHDAEFPRRIAARTVTAPARTRNSARVAKTSKRK
ncbi:MAG TPA: hypothetical protein VFN10_02370 [Thermoanaerobaculia bacterium]|nr:hypothetical protein [Thermoanaerobaculia bacterium]